MNVISWFRYRSTNTRQAIFVRQKRLWYFSILHIIFLTATWLLLREQPTLGPRPTLGYYWGYSLTYPMLITETYRGFFKNFNPKVTGSFVNAISCQICSIPFWYKRYNIWSHLFYNKILMWYAYLSDLNSSIKSLRLGNGNFPSVIPQ